MTIINGGTFKKGVANGFKKTLEGEGPEETIELKGTTTIAGGKFQDDVTNTLGTVSLAGGVFATKPDDATNGKTLAAQKKLFALTPQTITAEQPVSYAYGVGSIDDFVLRDITESYKKDNYTLTATAPTTGTSIEGYGIDLSYQWAKKNTTSDNYDDISGATSNTHNVKNVADSGDYRCTIMSGDAVIQQLDANVAISKSAVPVTAPTAKNNNLIFNNMDQELISEGTATDGTLYYMLADEKPAADNEGWTADASTIKGKNAGSYQVWYKAVATDTDNRTDFAVVDTPLTVQINKTDIPSADITAPQAITGLFYTPAEQALIKAGSVKGGKMQYAVTAEDVHTAPQDANAWQDTVPKKKAIGTYRIWYKAVPDDTENFNESTPESFTVVINKSDITTNDFIAPATLNPTYNSSPVQLVSAGKVPDGCTMSYMISNKLPALDATGWETDVTKITANSTGTYYVWYKVDGATNYNNLTAQSVKVTVSQYVAPSSSTTITKVGQIWTLTMDSYKYDGTAHTPTIDGTTYGGVTYTYYNADTNEKLAEAPSAVGNYKVKVYAPGNASYYGRSQTATYSITEAEPVVNVLNIDEQPKDVTCMIGEMAVFTVKASGENLTYQWEFNSGYGWRTSTMNGANTDTISIPMSELRNGQQYRCIVKSGNDAVTSEAAAMYAASCITEQPKDCSGAIGNTAKFTVKTLGEVKSYQWQYQRNNGWKSSGMSGFDTDTISVPFSPERNGQQYRCIVTFTDGTTQISEVGAMQMKPCIVEQPKDFTGMIGNTAKFTVKAFGEAKSYQWQYNKGNGWKYSGMSGYDTATVEVPLIKSRDGQQYRCIITTADGTMLVTSAVTMSVEK